MKICKTCGREIKIRKREGYRDWSKRKYCSRDCWKISDEWKKNLSNSKKTKFDEEIIEKMIQLYINNTSLEEIGKLFGCGRCPIKRILEENNIKTSRVKPHTGDNLWDYKGTKGKKHSLEVIEKIRKAMKSKDLYGKDNPFYGKKHSKKTKEKWSKNRKILWLDKEFRERTLKAQRRGANIKPNKPEKIMINLLNQSFPNQFLYTGDGKVWFDGFNPDFICNPYKKIIELFGDYWHNLQGVKERDKRRLEAYSKYGFQILIIWEHELKNLNQVINKINEFRR